MISDVQRVNKEIKTSARNDRTLWMEKALTDGSWHRLNKVRKPRGSKRLKLQSANGGLVDSNEWANTMAMHLESAQWKLRTTGNMVDHPLGEASD